jgi:hypothetical protein
MQHLHFGHVMPTVITYLSCTSASQACMLCGCGKRSHASTAASHLPPLLQLGCCFAPADVCVMICLAGLV